MFDDGNNMKDLTINNAESCAICLDYVGLVDALDLDTSLGEVDGCFRSAAVTADVAAVAAGAAEVETRRAHTARRGK